MGWEGRNHGSGVQGCEKEKANTYIDIPINTGIGHARNCFVVASADCVIACEGSIGTLSEIAMALNYREPVVIIKGTRFEKIFKEKFERFREELKVKFSAAEKAVNVAIGLIDKS